MRKKKFRAWHKPTKTMLPINGIIALIEFNVDNTISSIGIQEYTQIDEKGNMDWQPVEYQGKDIELIEYIGIKDRNGKEIYEGDVIKGKFDIEKVEDFILLGLTEKEKKEQEIKIFVEDIFYLYTNPIPEDIEVIGNIFENPELLE